MGAHVVDKKMLTFTSFLFYFILFLSEWDVTFFPFYENFVLEILRTLILKKAWVS